MTSQQKADDLTVCLVSAGLLCWIHSDKIAGPLSLIGPSR